MFGNLQRSIFLTVVIWLVVVSPTMAQDPDLRFTHLTSANGLSSDRSGVMLQDHHGFMWFGTSSGLNRYDGYSFMVYRHLSQNPNSLSSNNVQAIYEDGEGNLWIGTDNGGLNKFNPTTEKFTIYRHDETNPNSLLQDRVLTIYVDKEGIFWLGTLKGMNRFDPKTETFTAYKTTPDNPHSLIDKEVRMITSDTQGNIWAVTRKDGLNKLDPRTGKVTWYKNDPNDPNSLSDNNLWSVYAAKDNKMWIGTIDHSLELFDPSTNIFTHDPAKFGKLLISRISPVKDSDKLWLCTGDGLILLDPQSYQFTRYKNDPADPNSLSDSNINNVYYDNVGTLWVGTANKGVDRYNAESVKFTHFRVNPATPNNSLSSNIISGFYEDVEDNLWVATDGYGLNKIIRATGVITSYRSNPDNADDPTFLVDKVVLFIQPDKEGYLWLGGYTGGLRKFDPRTGKVVENYKKDPDNPDKKSPEFSASNYLPAMYIDPDGLFWIATGDNGMQRFDPKTKTFTHYPMNKEEGLEIIYQSGNHLLTLINDILDLSKIEARKMELYEAPLHLLQFLEGVAGIVRMRAQQKDLRFVFESHGDLPKGVIADEKRLRQILINLLGNAIKFTKEGKITLRVTGLSISIQQDKPKCQIRFEVIDTGVGMTPEQLTKIFDPFEQVGDMQKRAEGTGLGLAISRQLVQLMRGELWVKSEYGQGSTFGFDLPLEIVEVDEASSSMQTLRTDISGYQGEKRTILVADDRLANRLVLINLLEPLGFIVETAEDGHKLVERAKEIKPDLILTDLIMPVMTGFEAVDALRQIDEFKDLPVIAISASVFEMNQEKSRLAGCDAFLPKPIELTKLLPWLEKLLQLQWVYSSETVGVPTTQTSSGEVVPPPGEVVEKLYELAKLGLLRDVNRELMDLEEQGGQYSVFVQQARDFVKAYEDEALANFLKKFI